MKLVLPVAVDAVVLKMIPHLPGPLHSIFRTVMIMMLLTTTTTTCDETDLPYHVCLLYKIQSVVVYCVV